MRKKIAVAIVGVGNMGTNHARVLATVPGVSIVGICDSNKVRAGAVAEQVDARAYSSVKELLANESVDAAIVAVPTHHHLKVGLELLGGGVHVLMEKPLSVNLKECRQLMAMARKMKRVLFVGHVERFNPAVEMLRRIALRGDLGEPLSLNFRRVGLYSPNMRDESVILDLAIHDIDVAIALTGRMPTQVFARAGSIFGGKQEDYADILLDFGTSQGIIESNWVTPIKARTLIYTGSKGYAELDYINRELMVRTSADLRQQERTEAKLFSFQGPDGEPLRRELINFLQTIKGGENGCSGEDGMQAVLVAQAAMKSAQSHQAVSISVASHKSSIIKKSKVFS